MIINSIAFVFFLCLFGGPSKLNSEVSFKNAHFKTYQKNFYGTIGNLGVKMTLYINEKSNGNASYTGYYSYNHIGKKITIAGNWYIWTGKRTYIELTEKVGGNVTGYFSLLPGNLGNYTTLAGTWFSTSGKQLKVNLRSVKK
jgi:hypothetical protein